MNKIRGSVAESDRYVALYVAAQGKQPGACYGEMYGEMQAQVKRVIEAAQAFAVGLIQCSAGQGNHVELASSS